VVPRSSCASGQCGRTEGQVLKSHVPSSRDARTGDSEEASKDRERDLAAHYYAEYEDGRLPGMTDQATSRTVTRAELYDQVWSTPMLKLAAQYGITNVGLAKICKRLAVPTPGLGYWARIQHGQKPPRLALPPLKQGRPGSATITPSVPRLVSPGSPPSLRAVPPTVPVHAHPRSAPLRRSRCRIRFERRSSSRSSIIQPVDRPAEFIAGVLVQDDVRSVCRPTTIRTWQALGQDLPHADRHIRPT
jgi:hypothetical protein